MVFLALLVGLAALVAHIAAPGSPRAAAPPTSTMAPTLPPTQVAQNLVTVAPSATTAAPSSTAAIPTATVEQTSTASSVIDTHLPVQITPGGPLPTRTATSTPTPRPTATPDGNASLVIARDVDTNGNPVKAALRFLSPATRLYGVAVLHTVHPEDVLRFVFERDGKVLPHDDISYAAGGDGSSQTFNAYADYANGTQPLPHGSYQLLFYRNGHLEAIARFQVG